MFKKVNGIMKLIVIRRNMARDIPHECSPPYTAVALDWLKVISHETIQYTDDVVYRERFIILRVVR